MSIILAGLPCSGKTTLLQIFKEKYQWRCVDTDNLIEALYYERIQKKATCRMIYKEHGEQLFRDLEKEVLFEMQKGEYQLISLGGGLLEDCMNRDKVALLGPLIYLQASFDFLWHRMMKRGIPAYLNLDDPEKDFYLLSIRRIPQYEKMAKRTLDVTTISTEEIEAIILQEGLDLYGK